MENLSLTCPIYMLAPPIGSIAGATAGGIAGSVLGDYIRYLVRQKYIQNNN